MEYPALINVKLFFNGATVYSENLPFRNEPIDEDVNSFVKLIRPNMKYDYILNDYIRPLKNTEK